jgi:2,4-dienoyl-CoA reductase (NADPH2)
MAGHSRYPRLLESGYIGKVKTRNRIVKTANGTGFPDLNRPIGYINEKHLAYYGALARGGVGLIITEPCPIEYPRGSHRPDIARIDTDEYLPGHIELVKVIHQYGCPVFLQMLHAGPWHRQNPSGVPGFKDYFVNHEAKHQPIAASPLKLPAPDFEVPREMTAGDIQDVVNKAATNIARAQKAGYDGVELDVSTCHLINTFLSRAWNKRQDEYGYQSMENRTRFPVEIIKEAKRRTGKNFPLSMLINAVEIGIDQGITVEEAQEFSKIFEDAGADVIHVRSYGYGPYELGWLMHRLEHFYYPEERKPLPGEFEWKYKGHGGQISLAEAIKKAVSIPVIAIGGRIDPDLGEQFLREGKADFIGMARRLIADQELPNKVISGRMEEIRNCLACDTCSDMLNHNITCRINAALGGSEDYVVNPAQQKKKVVVVGSGPGGMEAARVAALRGHEVILYDKEPKLGGLLPLAAIVKGFDIENLLVLIRYYRIQLIKLGVKIKLGKEFTPSLLQEIKPDVIIVAAGGKLAVPEIPGIDRRNVVSSAKLHHQLKNYLKIFSPEMLGRLTKLWMPIGKNVVIIGAQIQGCEVAEFLVKRGRKVTIVDSAETFGNGIVELNKALLFPWFTEKGVKILTGVKYEKITDRGLTLVTRENQKVTLEADTIVTAIPSTPNTTLFDAIKGKAQEVYSIGDCKEPRLIQDAIAEAYYLARSL